MNQPPDLVAKPKEDDAVLKGAGLGDSIEGLVGTVTDDGELNAFALAMDGVSIGLDVLSMVMNPLGELVKAGVGWLMEHLDFIREPLELLTGNPELVQQAAQTWNNVAAELEAIAGDYQGSLSTTSGWDGDAATAYRKLALQYTASLHYVAEEAKEAARWVTTGGMVVAAARAIVFDIIATFISDVITRALLALASSWFTLGGSVAAFTASIFAEVVSVIAKIQKKIGKLLGAIQRFVKKFNLMGERTTEAARTLGRKSSELGQEANRAIKSSDKTLQSLAPNAGKVKKYADYVERAEGSTVGEVVGHGATLAGKEAGKTAAENYDQYSGGSKDKGQVTPRSGRISGSLNDDA